MDRSSIHKTFGLLAQSEAIRRYSRDRVQHDETLLAHTGWVSLWSLLAAEDLNAVTGYEIDYARLMRRAVLHDIDEIGTGDIPRTTKYATKEIRSALDDLARKFVRSLEKQLQIRVCSLLDDWSEAKDEETLEGRIIIAADIASVVYKVWSEMIVHGNMEFARVANELYDVITKVLNRIDTGKSTPPNTWFVGMYYSMREIVDEAIELPRAKVTLKDSLDFSV